LKLAAARIFVRNLEEATTFYESTLALRVGAGAPEVGYVAFETGACDFIVEQVAPDAPEDEQILVGRFTGLSFNVEDIESSFQELSSRGVEFTGKPERQQWGGTLATLRDPAGNELQLVQYPGAT
jgi:predicted enzyme related to lactoylglutathione lyase